MKDDTGAGTSRRPSESQFTTNKMLHPLWFPPCKRKRERIAGLISLLRFKIPALHYTLENLKLYFTFSCCIWLKKINLECSQLISYIVDCCGLGKVISSLVLPLKPWSLPPTWGRKGKNHRLRFRTIYWKQHWGKKTNINSNNASDRGYKKRKYSSGKYSQL